MIFLVIYVCIVTCHVPIKGGYGSCYVLITCSEKTACVTAKKNGIKKPKGFEELYKREM